MTGNWKNWPDWNTNIYRFVISTRFKNKYWISVGDLEHKLTPLPRLKRFFSNLGSCLKRDFAATLAEMIEKTGKGLEMRVGGQRWIYRLGNECWVTGMARDGCRSVRVCVRTRQQLKVVRNTWKHVVNVKNAKTRVWGGWVDVRARTCVCWPRNTS